MKIQHLQLVFFYFLFSTLAFAQNPSAIVEYESTDKGMLIPRLTDTTAVSSPATGLLIYDLSTNAFQYFDGMSWKQIDQESGTSVWTQNPDTSIYYQDGMVGIGTNIPQAILDVSEDVLINNLTVGRGGGNITSNTAVGESALYHNGTGATTTYHGDLNTAIGRSALYNNTIGRLNVAIGSYSLYLNTTGGSNIANGVDALSSNQTGSGNIAVGTSALKNNTSGGSNIAVGDQAMYENNQGGGNIALGSKSLFSNTTGSFNVSIGLSALDENISASNTVAIGERTLGSNTTGERNTAVGQRALVSNLTGGYNAAFGSIALLSNTSGGYNSALGYTALYSNTTGSNNCAVGYSAFSIGSSYSNSTAIGYDAEPNASNRVRLGNAAVTSIGGAVSWSVLSDARFKIGVEADIPGLAFINELNPVSYQLDMDAIAGFRNTPDSLRLFDAEQERSGIRYTGFLAQEVEQAANSVSYEFSGIEKPSNENDNYSLRYAEFVVPLVKAVQELSNENEMMRTELASQNAIVEKQNIELIIQNELFEQRLKKLEQQ